MPIQKKNNSTRSIVPAVGRMLSWPQITALLEHQPRTVVVKACREVAEYIRIRIAAGEKPDLSPEAVSLLIGQRITTLMTLNLKPVINATGIVIHTNLGRSPLASEALQAVATIAKGYSNLEYELEQGKRGSRNVHIKNLLCELTGAQSALVVNNCAAAVLLALATFAKGKEVIVSRGELVEIGGSFRMPEIMKASGAILVEVGTTNRTHLKDYEKAINENTAAILRVHHSNYRISGFVASPSVKDICDLAHSRGIMVFEDLGSGCMIDRKMLGFGTEPTAKEILASGVDLCTFSGDKLLGGPQAGIILGKPEAIQQCAANPLARALRVDKMTLAGLEATLQLYRDPHRALERIPVLAMAVISQRRLKIKAARLAAKISKSLGSACHVKVVQVEGYMGGGSLPMEELSSFAVSVSPKDIPPQKIASCLRAGSPAVIVRIAEDAVLIDVRTLLDGQDSVIHHQIVNVFKECGKK